MVGRAFLPTKCKSSFRPRGTGAYLDLISVVIKGVG
jgi:hypothetical protein